MSGPTPLPPLATREQYEAMTGQTAPANIDDLLNAASAGIRRFCGWHIAPNIVQDLVLDGEGGRTLILPTLKLTGITSLVEVSGDWSWTADPLVDLTWSFTGRVRKRSGCWTLELAGITTTISHGFDLADVGDLSQLVLGIVARNVANPYGYTAQAVGGVSISMPASSAGGATGVSLTEPQAVLIASYALERKP